MMMATVKIVKKGHKKCLLGKKLAGRS